MTPLLVLWRHGAHVKRVPGKNRVPPLELTTSKEVVGPKNYDQTPNCLSSSEEKTKGWKPSSPEGFPTVNESAAKK